MKFLNRLQLWAALISTAVIVVSPLQARTRKGDKAFKLGDKAAAQKDYDHAVNFYDEALATDPRDAAYMLADQRMHAEAANWHVTQGRKLQQAQQLEPALVEFQKAYLDDPSSQIALQEIRQTTAMVKEKEKAAAGTHIPTPAERARDELEKRINSLEGPPQLRPITEVIRSLKMNNQPVRVLYESVGKLAGINVLFDPSGLDSNGIGGGGNRNFNLDLNNVTLEEALNYIALETHTFWKAISQNAIFVTQESEPKRQEYQDEIVKVFYIQNATSTAEFTEIFNAVRTAAKLNTGLFQVQSQNAIIARGSPDTLAIIEKVIHDLDKPKAEVLMDVIVMEVNRNRTITLGAALLGQGGLSIPSQFTPRNPSTIQTPTTGTGTDTTGTGTTGTGGTGTGTTGNSGYTTFAQLGHISTGDFSVQLPNALLQALLSDASSRVLQRPQIRATDGGKASLKVGTKVPYVSGSLNSAIATPGSIPYATTQFATYDVGVNIDFQPHVNGPQDISMHVKVDISNVAGFVPIAGISEPELSQRINEADIRMRDGEVSILGGVSDVENNNSVAGVPGITNIPILGYLFGTKTRSKIDDQILVALVPHIIRAPDLSAIGEQGVLAGTERVVHVEHKPDGAMPEATPSPAGVENAPGNVPAQPSPTPSAPAGPAAPNPYIQPQQPQPRSVAPFPNGTPPPASQSH